MDKTKFRVARRGCLFEHRSLYSLGEPKALIGVCVSPIRAELLPHLGGAAAHGVTAAPKTEGMILAGHKRQKDFQGHERKSIDFGWSDLRQ